MGLLNLTVVGAWVRRHVAPTSARPYYELPASAASLKPRDWDYNREPASFFDS